MSFLQVSWGLDISRKLFGEPNQELHDMKPLSTLSGTSNFFMATPASGYLKPGDKQAIYITFNPMLSHSSQAACHLDLITNSVGVSKLLLRGTGGVSKLSASSNEKSVHDRTLRGVAETLEFGCIKLHTSKERSFWLFNEGELGLLSPSPNRAVRN